MRKPSDHEIRTSPPKLLQQMYPAWYAARAKRQKAAAMSAGSGVTAPEAPSPVTADVIYEEQIPASTGWGWMHYTGIGAGVLALGAGTYFVVTRLL